MLSAIVHNMRQHERPEELLNGFLDIILKFPNDWSQLMYHDIILVMRSENNHDFIEAFREHPLHEELENRITI